jgi:polyferredoxin
MQTWIRVRDFVTSRWLVKLAFLAYFVFACVQLMRFAAWARGNGPYVSRPESPAGLLPVGHFTSFFAFVRGGGWDTLLPAGLVIIIGAFTVSLLFRRGFCGWICPLGTVWELFSAAGHRLMGRNVRVPRRLDIAGRVVRYVLTAAIVVLLLLVVSVAEAVAFRSLPYMWVADIKTISLIITPTFLIVAAFAGILSALFGPVWCRYLCPLGGMYSTVAALSPCAVHRDAEACASCGKCSEACHAFIDVEHARVVRDTECDGCMECVRVCTAENALEPRAFGRFRVTPWVWPVLVVGLWLAIFGFAYATGNWRSSIPAEQFKATINSGILEHASTPNQQ